MFEKIVMILVNIFNGNGPYLPYVSILSQRLSLYIYNYSNTLTYFCLEICKGLTQ